MEIDFSSPDFLIPVNPQSEFEKKTLAFVQEFLSVSPTVSVQTSGSTGKPKIFDIEKSKMISSAGMTCDFLDLKEGNTALLCLPVEYISGKMMIVRSIERKLKLYIEEPSLSPLKNLDHEIDFCAMTPLQVEHSLDKIHWIKKLIIGGAAVSESLKKKVLKKLQSFTSNIQHPTSNIFETYGMSETLSHIALKEIYPHEQEYFQLFEGIEINQDERGCLTINAPKLNAEILHTNDIVEIKPLSSGKEFRFLGRADHIINSGGAKIFPEQLERIVKKEIPNEAIFLGIPDEKFGQQLVLALEGDYSVSCHDRISSISYEKSFQKPKEIFFVQEFPRTPNGKVNRHELLSLVLKGK